MIRILIVRRDYDDSLICQHRLGLNARTFGMGSRGTVFDAKCKQWLSALGLSRSEKVTLGALYSGGWPSGPR